MKKGVVLSLLLSATLFVGATAVGGYDPGGPAVSNQRLVGLGCGPQRLTFTAAEEDHFPTCDTIDTPENLCGVGVTAEDCAIYMGDGW